MGCHFLLQGIFPNPGLNLHLLHYRLILYHRVTWEAKYTHPVVGADPALATAWAGAEVEEVHKCEV